MSAKTTYTAEEVRAIIFNVVTEIVSEQLTLQNQLLQTRGNLVDKYAPIDKPLKLLQRSVIHPAANRS